MVYDRKSAADTCLLLIWPALGARQFIAEDIIIIIIIIIKIIKTLFRKGHRLDYNGHGFKNSLTA